MSDEGATPRTWSSEVRFGLIAVGLLAGIVLGAALGWVLRPDPDGDPDRDPTPPLSGDAAPASPEDAAAFVDAWDRSRRETYLAVSTWRRETAAGSTIERVRVVAQRPPDRVLSSGASLRGSLEGRYVQCEELAFDGSVGIDGGAQEDAGADSDGADSDGTDIDGEVDVPVACQERPDGFGLAEYQALVDEEVAALSTYVTGEPPLYRVQHRAVAGADCFDLRLVLGMRAPPYGNHATFCFDAASGAPSTIRVQRPEGTDTLELVTVTAEVTDDDLAALMAGTFTPGR
jgi:hypothetical protein